MQNALASPVRTAVARRSGLRKPTGWIAAGLLLIWVLLTLGSYTPVLLGLLALTALAVRVLRYHRDVALTVVIAALTAAAPTAAVIHQVAAGTMQSATAAALTAYIAAAPTPALLVLSYRPGRISRPLHALLGSGLLLLGVAVIVVFNGWGHPDEIAFTTIVSSWAVVHLGYRRACRRQITGLVTTEGWTELGGRRLPGGGSVHQLLIGNGWVIAAWYFSGNTPAPTEQQLTRRVRQAVDVAAALRVSPGRVQPVLLSRSPGQRWHQRLINTGGTAAQVVVADRDALPGLGRAISATKPRTASSLVVRTTRRWQDRSAVLNAAFLPSTRNA